LNIAGTRSEWRACFERQTGLEPCGLTAIQNGDGIVSDPSQKPP
jgi:hypothetical protein